MTALVQATGALLRRARGLLDDALAPAAAQCTADRIERAAGEIEELVKSAVTLSAHARRSHQELQSSASVAAPLGGALLAVAPALNRDHLHRSAQTIDRLVACAGQILGELELAVASADPSARELAAVADLLARVKRRTASRPPSTA